MPFFVLIQSCQTDNSLLHIKENYQGRSNGPPQSHGVMLSSSSEEDSKPPYSLQNIKASHKCFLFILALKARKGNCSSQFASAYLSVH